MGVATFCKAFPWHFVMDRRLELVQLGSGFMRLFGSMLTSCGTSAATYFEFHRPRSIILSFSEIIKRANTPFVLAIRSLAGLDSFPAEVSSQYYSYSRIFDLLLICSFSLPYLLDCTLYISSNLSRCFCFVFYKVRKSFPSGKSID